MSGTFCLFGPSSLLSGEAWCWAQGLTHLASKGLFSSLSGSNKACTVPWADGQGGVGYPPEAGDLDLPLADSTGMGGGLRGGGAGQGRSRADGRVGPPSDGAHTPTPMAAAATAADDPDGGQAPAGWGLDWGGTDLGANAGQCKTV